MVCLGSMFSAVWIIVANAWMQTLRFHLIGEGMQTKLLLLIFGNGFNPSGVRMLIHAIIGCWLMGVFVMSISAWYILKINI